RRSVDLASSWRRRTPAYIARPSSWRMLFTEQTRARSYFPRMHGWKHVDTARCAGCAIYTPVVDLKMRSDGRLVCGSAACARSIGGKQSNTRPDTLVDEAMVWAEAPAISVTTMLKDARVRWVTAAVVALAIAFPLAAWVSQL